MEQDPTDPYYRRLEIGPAASHAEVVQAYRRLAHRAHPDAHPGDPEAPERFRELTEAYEVLSDPTRRAAYDACQGLPGPTQSRSAVFGAGSTPSHPLDVAQPRTGVGYSQPVRDAANLSFSDVPLRAGPVRVEGSDARDQALRPGSESYGDDAFGRLVAALLHSLRRR